MLFDLELVSPCNARCSFCPQRFRGVKRKQPLMDVDVLDKITGEICEMAQQATQEHFQVSLCGMGENLLRKPLVIRALDNIEPQADWLPWRTRKRSMLMSAAMPTNCSPCNRIFAVTCNACANRWMPPAAWRASTPNS